GEIDEVRRVDRDRPDPLASGIGDERIGIRGWLRTATPGGRVVAEDLERPRPDLARSSRRRHQPAPDAKVKPHGWRLRRPAQPPAGLTACYGPRHGAEERAGPRTNRGTRPPRRAGPGLDRPRGVLRIGDPGRRS